MSKLYSRILRNFIEVEYQEKQEGNNLNLQQKEHVTII